MSDDVIKCWKQDKHERSSASYTLKPIHHASSELFLTNDDRISLKITQKLRQHRNRYRINRDIRDVRRTCSDSIDSERTCDSSFTHPLRFSRSYRLLNLCLILILHIICNEFVTSVNCDELYDSVGARGHYTHTWAVHIPGGDEIAAKVADDHNMHLRGKIFDDHYHFEHKSLVKRSIEPSSHHQRRLDEDERVLWSKQQRAKSRQKRDFTRLKPVKSLSSLLNDPKWPSMWYLNRGGGYDMNVIPAWKEGITGKGVVVTILDDGLETDHPDLERNYDPEASYDVNSHDSDPMPHYDLADSNRHGTRCAGEVAATANNSLCSVGIAFNAKVGGVRMLDGDVTDAVEAASLGLKSQHIDIYSASWGPDDDGKTVDGPGEMATKAFIDGVTKGRGGKGSIFIWASGNGGREQDNCNCDGYTNSIWTLSISSATEFGDIPWYSEKCSSTLATTYSSGQQNEKQVVTTDLHHLCTSSHTGTSASAPLAAGIAALVLEANRNLTWRDLQHIVVRTANPAYLGKSPTEWTTNGVGRKVSHSFGYGLMDAAAMVRLARVWETVPEQQRCEIHSPHLDKPIPPRRNVTFTLKVDHCKGVNFLEHVQARISLTTQRRGDIVIYITSPAGTRTCLLTERIHDVSRSGFNDWPFMTVHQWGESPQGIWELEIHNKGRYMVQITQWNLIFHGTNDPAQKNDPPRLGKKKTVNDLVHNSLENSQWGFITQDVTDADAHLDVQRTVDRDRTTSSACQRYSDNNKNYCLECKSSFIYDGKCFDECPERTFIVPERISTLSGNVRSKGLSLRKREAHIDEYDNLSDIIGHTESLLVKNRAIMLASNQKMCGSCHESCLKCKGTSENDCITCDENYNQIIMGSNINCIRKSSQTTNSLLESIEHELRNYSTLKIILISFTIGVLLFITCISIYLLGRKFNFVKTQQPGKYSYNQLLQEAEEIKFSKSPNILPFLNVPIDDDDDDNDDDDDDDNENEPLKL